MSELKLKIPDFDAPTVVFGARLETYPKMEDLPEEFRREKHPCCDIAQSLFFKGGSLSDHGLKFKPEVDGKKALNAIRAWLGSWDPKHEHKIAAVGYALSQWCEDCERTEPAPKQTSTSKKRRKCK